VAGRALRDGVYSARIDLAHDGRTIAIDARPSDAIALALRFAAPLFVQQARLERPDELEKPPRREVHHDAPERQVRARSL